jgi:hypothetical protein
MRYDNLMRYIQAQTEFPGFRRLQRLEERTELCGGHATARITHLKTQLMPQAPAA